ncbi:MAG: hypothetical protein GY722_27520 [bacterium]|nr:hypothetical protein [bacterium]
MNTTGDALHASWETSIGSFTGLGLFYSGRLLLSRIPGVVQPGKEPGIVWYTMSGSGDFDAVWSSGPLNGKIGTGSADGGIPGCLTGRRRILYFDPNGNALPPALDLEIDSHGKAFRLTWKNGAQTSFDGVGLATARGLCSAWSPSKPDAVKTLLVLAALSPCKAKGTSATQGRKRLGEEILRRVVEPEVAGR